MLTKLEDTGASEDVYDLQHALEQVLATIVDIYEAAAMPLPSRRYWTIGRAAEDCEQVTVSFLQMYLGAPGDQAATPQKCNAPRSATINIAVTRKVATTPKSGTPAVDKIMEASAYTAADITLLMSSVKAFDNWDGLGIGPGVIATVSAPDASGGMQTVNLNLIMAIP